MAFENRAMNLPSGVFRHQDRRAGQLTRAQPAQRLVRLGQRQHLDLRPHRHFRRERQESRARRAASDWRPRRSASPALGDLRGDLRLQSGQIRVNNTAPVGVR